MIMTNFGLDNTFYSNRQSLLKVYLGNTGFTSGSNARFSLGNQIMLGLSPFVAKVHQCSII